MYENRGQALISTKAFKRRVVRHFAVGAVILLGSLGIGMAGYGYFEGLGWLDSFLAAAMLLGGMGPIGAIVTPGGKFFAGVYALYAGMVFLVTASVVLAPIAHRVMHHFHLKDR